VARYLAAPGAVMEIWFLADTLYSDSHQLT